jgi:hypothetical protein
LAQSGIGSSIGPEGSGEIVAVLRDRDVTLHSSSKKKSAVIGDEQTSVAGNIHIDIDIDIDIE